ncbi:sulfatase-like hydrolase/transferase [Helicobacter heilmannii]|uniref:sulfatase-like hydrolase/transferase n=1 Tax=Helicobacter heilmannii TaxID=35817 RepID=UPI00131526D6|nr:sulfatase-like hydrolase/transferase [Helicobacter heilmannii]GMB95092.1 hypothetical protein NHP21011_11910 [Helicobacter heilmannii]
MGKVVLDNRFWLMWLAPVVGAFFAVEVWEGVFWHALKVGFYGLLFFYLYYLLLSFVPRIVAEFLKNAMFILSLGFNLVDIFLAHYFYMDFSPSSVATLLATNIKESRSFLEGMVLPRLDFILGYLLTCVGFLSLMRLKLCLNRVQSFKGFGIIFMIFWIHTLWVFFVHGGGGHGRLINSNIAKHVMPVVKEVYAVCVALKEFSQIKAIYTGLNQPYPKNYLRVDSNSVPNVVLIVGESASRDFMGVYGYSVPNTPFLSGLLRERERERRQNRLPRLISLSLTMSFLLKQILLRCLGR